jgi:hypothetical protein
MTDDASSRIDAYIAALPGWQRSTAARLRALIHEADAAIVEEWKWDVPVFAQRGMVCAIGAFKDHMKVNFFKGASLDDARSLFNAGLEAKASRAIDIREGDAIDEAGLVDLVRAAVARNR